MSKKDDTYLYQALTLLKGERGDQAALEINASIAKAVAEFTGGHSFVQSAVLLDDNEKQRIENLLKQVFKKDIKPQFSVNPHLLGGFRISVGDWKLDTSLAAKILGLTGFLGGKST